MTDENHHDGYRDREARRARIRAGIESVAGKYSLGMSTDDYMALIRGPYPDEESSESDNG